MTTKIANAVALLESHFGIPQWSGPRDPLETLVSTILSQNTTGTNRDRAIIAFKQRFNNWEDIRRTSPNELADVIRVAGLANQRSKRIIALLKWVKRRFGDYDLSEMCTWSFQQALDELIPLPGIGIKTISVTMLFACGMDLCPVDTHVYRVVRRLGWAPETSTRDQVYYHLEDKFPEGKGYSLHINLIRLGRQICKPQSPQCPECPLNIDCDYIRLA